MSQAGFKTYAEGDLIARVYFSFDQSQLTNESKYILDKLEQDLQHSGSDLLLEGHTDSIGAEQYNMKLGLNRAQAVEQHLLTLGANQAHLITATQGETTPIATNESEEGRAKNRRVDLTKAE
jgi:outer membrane protein OmpA-like peptidoglycan-associated protein